MTNETFEDPNATVKPGSQPTQGNAENTSITNDINQQNEQISELKSLVNSLTLAFQASQVRSAQNAAFQDAVTEVTQIARAMAIGSIAPSLEYPAAPKPSQTEKSSERCGCECMSPDCCEFEIVLRKVRASRPQIEPPDAGDIPLAENAMEIRLYVTADGAGFMFPSFASTIDLRADGIPPGPGPWVNIEKVINRVQVKKGVTRNVELYVEVEEDDSRLTEQAVGAGKNEFGEVYGTISLNCCLAEIYPPMPLDVDLRYGGEGRGGVTVVIYARRICC